MSIGSSVASTYLLINNLMVKLTSNDAPKDNKKEKNGHNNKEYWYEDNCYNNR